MRDARKTHFSDPGNFRKTQNWIGGTSPNNADFIPPPPYEMKRALDDLTEWFDFRFNVLEEADLFRRIAYSWELDYVNSPLAKWRTHSSSWTWSKYELFAKEGEMEAQHDLAQCYHKGISVKKN
jgi:hypothetical protein